MYTVLKLEPRTILEENKIENGRIKLFTGKQTKNKITWAVITPNGEFAKDTNGNYEIYNLKSAATMTANHLNQR